MQVQVLIAILIDFVFLWHCTSTSPQWQACRRSNFEPSPFDSLFKATLSIKDDVTGKVDFTTTNMDVPDGYSAIPGGPVHAPANAYKAADVSDPSTEKAFVMPSTHFGSLANISHIEFYPMSGGSLVVEVRNCVFIY